MLIQDTTKKYKDKLDHFDLQLLLASAIKKPKEFVMIHPEYKLTNNQSSVINKMIKRRIEGEPIAYILGHKEFYGLDFIVNKHTLVPRPETEMMVELGLDLLHSMLRNTVVIDIGTGSGNIIVSLAHAMNQNDSYQLPVTSYYAVDISDEALRIAKKNAKLNGVDKKIKFLHGSLLEPLLNEFKCSMFHVPRSIIITANLPYLSKEIYNSTPVDVRNFEPKSALYSAKAGLAHYEKLLKQIKALQFTGYGLQVTGFLEISPEQKQPLTKLIKTIFPTAKIKFKKDLASKWRICIIKIK